MQEMKSEGRHFANKDFVENLKKTSTTKWLETPLKNRQEQSDQHQKNKDSQTDALKL